MVTRLITVIAIVSALCFAQKPDWKDIKSKPIIASSEYNFAAQSPGGSLTGGVSSTVTLRPCPAGVAGSNTSHYLYISGGTGTAEAVLITGGTCTSGASAGTVIFTPANSHSGAFTIRSATGGIQEAICGMATAGGEVVVTYDIVLRANVGACGKTQPIVRKRAGASITGSFTILERGADSRLIEWSTGSQVIVAKMGSANNTNTALEIVPEAHDPWPATYGAAVSIYQDDHTKLDMNQFFHGLAAVLHTNNPGPSNQNAAVLGFMYSHGGADPFGADFHAIVPDTATSAPTYAVGVQAETQVDKAGSTLVYPLLISHNSTVGKKATTMILLTTGNGAGAGTLMTTAPGVMTDEGIVLIPANDLNPSYRAIAVTNAANTVNTFAVQKDGAIVSRGGYAQLINNGSTGEAGVILHRVGDPLVANREYLVFGADARLPSAYEFNSEATGTGSVRPLVFSIDSTEKARFDTSPGILLGGSRVQNGAGSPNGAVVGSPGDLYLNVNGGANTTLYIKESGVATNTGWVAK